MRPIKAVIFDMDGVVTDTAHAHATSWKRLFDEYLDARSRCLGKDLDPFDEDHDYREYVDGKPRYDGVKSFLDSRGIELPFGDPSDSPEKNTICGLGNRKNAYFHDWLDNNQVRTYPSTISLIKKLRLGGIKTGLFTSSRNGHEVVKNAGVEGLFDTRVDGNDLAELSIPGKPDPAMLCETASRLGALPADTAVFEDAISGVEAGSAGGFGLVVGVNRDDYASALTRHGADLVVRDLGELAFDGSNRLSLKTMRNLPSVWDFKEEIRRRLRDRKTVVFLDYDGTLTPIVEDFNKAFLADDMRNTIGRLANRCTVGIISGRDLSHLKDLVDLDRVLYAGSHGFDIEMPGESRETLKIGEKFLPDLDAAEKELKSSLADIRGAAIERKRFAIAVHYRHVADDDIEKVEKIVDRVVDNDQRLHKGRGKKVFQIQPRADWNKGRAVDWLLERLELGSEAVLPIYIGDDLTDEDAFHSLAGTGITIGVGEEDRPTAADYSIATVTDVRRFLEFLITAINGEP